MPKRAWITGGAGFIGSHLCEALLSRGYEVHCFDNLSSGRLENIANLTLLKDFRLLRWDVDEKSLRDYDGDRTDVIFHLAGHASPVDYKSRPLETLFSSATGLKGALDAAAVHGCPLVFASTSEVYGKPTVIPTPEDTWGTVNTLGPRSQYDVGKMFGETLCMVYHRTFGVDARFVRIFNTYGPRMRPDDGRVVSSFIVQALKGQAPVVQGDGTQTRSFCYVSDTVEGLLALAARGKPIRAYNIGNPEEISIMDLAFKVLGKVAAVPEALKTAPAPDDPNRRCPDITRARTELGWAPRVSLDQGLDWTIKWFRERV